MYIVGSRWYCTNSFCFTHRSAATLYGLQSFRFACRSAATPPCSPHLFELRRSTTILHELQSLRFVCRSAATLLGSPHLFELRRSYTFVSERGRGEQETSHKNFQFLNILRWKVIPLRCWGAIPYNYKKLSDEGLADLTKSLQNGVVPYLVKFITRDDLGVQLLSASLIADMTLFPKAVDVLIDNGAVEQLSVLLDSSKDSVMQEEIIRSLGNMASVSQESYNKVTKTALCLLVHIYAKSESTPVSVLNRLEWTLSIIKRGFGVDEIEIDDLSSILSSIKEMISKENEAYILFACDSLSIITCPSTIDVFVKLSVRILIPLVSEKGMLS
ncbi:unnamed protein product [Vicia faba]|uniref:ARM repeat superfamily protein n=1 Tax=Vicia faba TaxID=3906 RepID=A0AAV1B7D9_VICFA|nr:unnamed protein product [Vicia faba]